MLDPTGEESHVSFSAVEETNWFFSSEAGGCVFQPDAHQLGGNSVLQMR